MSEIKASHTLDTKGLYCPEPVMMLHTQIDELATGDILEVIATDPSTKRDIPKFCRFLGHALLEQGEKESIFYYLIQKG